MALASQAWRARLTARDFLSAGNYDKAHEFASLAQNLHATYAGHRLKTITTWLAGKYLTSRSHHPIVE
jgi:phosphohistidine phosphatase SixA